MRQLFGQRWARDYGEAGGETQIAWQGALGQFSADEIGLALRSFENWESPHPPTFAEFRAACMAARQSNRPNWTDERLEAERDRERGGNPVAGVLEKLGKGKLTPIAKRELDRMARIMRGEEVETVAESYARLNLSKRWGPLETETTK